MNHQSPIRVLCIDDDAADVELMKYALDQTCVDVNYDLIVCEHGEKAIDLLEAPNYDIILLDFQIPRKNGIEVLEHVRAKPKLKHLPVILFSGSKVGNFMEKAEKLGISAFFLKPIDTAGFKEVFKRICNGWFKPIAEAKAS